MTRTCGVYVIRDMTDGRVYIGSSVFVEQRLGVHKRLLFLGRHFNPHLQRAWTAHNGSQFEFSIAEECDQHHLIDREQSWIDANHNSSFNVAGSATPGPSEGRTMWSQERRARHAELMRGNSHRRGRKTDPDTLQKQIVARTGKSLLLTEEERARRSSHMAELNTRINHSRAQNQKR